jgi:hypothetical protein
MSTDTQEYAMCVGYISGVGDQMRIISGGLGEHPAFEMFAICGSQSYGDMIQAFENWAEENPREWADRRALGVVAALSKKWPCKSK